MPRPRTKEDLMIAAKENYDKLNVLIAKLSDEELNTPFDFSSDEKKKNFTKKTTASFKLSISTGKCKLSCFLV